MQVSSSVQWVARAFHSKLITVLSHTSPTVGLVILVAGLVFPAIVANYFLNNKLSEAMSQLIHGVKYDQITDRQKTIMTCAATFICAVATTSLCLGAFYYSVLLLPPASV